MFAGLLPRAQDGVLVFSGTFARFRAFPVVAAIDGNGDKIVRDQLPAEREHVGFISASAVQRDDDGMAPARADWFQEDARNALPGFRREGEMELRDAIFGWEVLDLWIQGDTRAIDQFEKVFTRVSGVGGSCDEQARDNDQGERFHAGYFSRVRKEIQEVFKTMKKDQCRMKKINASRIGGRKRRAED